MANKLGSRAFSLNREDLLKIGKGAAIAAAGGFLAWCTTSLIPQLQAEGNEVTLVVAGVLMVAVNAAQKFLKNNS